MAIVMAIEQVMDRPVVLLVNPHVPDAMGEPLMENLAIGSLAAYLEHHGVSVELADCAIDKLPIGTLPRHVKLDDYQVAGITIMARSCVNAAMALAHSIRMKNPEIHLVSGGKFPTSNPDTFLFAGSPFDSVIRHDGESPLLELVQRVLRGEDWSSVPNLSRTQGNGSRHNPVDFRYIQSDLDRLPAVDRRYLPLFLGRNAPTTVSASRGCIYSCEFCVVSAESKSLWGKPQWRGRSAGSIADELEFLTRNFEISEIWFVDDLFLGPMPRGKKRIRELCNEIHQRGLKLGFSFEERSDSVINNKELFRELKRAGLRRVFLGLESGDMKTLTRYKKGSTPEQHLEAIDFLQQIGVEVSTGFILFDPFKRMENLEEEISFLRKLVHRRVFFPPVFNSALQLIREAPIFDQVVAAGLLMADGQHLEYDYDDQRVKCVAKALRWLFMSRNSTLFSTLKWLIGNEWRKREAFPGSPVSRTHSHLICELAAFYKTFVLDTSEKIMEVICEWPSNDPQLIETLDLNPLLPGVDIFSREIIFLTNVIRLAYSLEQHNEYSALAAN
ncbi:MAG: radical SAM protein [Arenicellales bacterium]|nr:radical SAM protein [Arenicellales bacterium]